MSSSVLDSYRIDEENFPLTLYRVHWPGAQTTYSLQGGFQAASNFTPYRVNGLRNAVDNHLDWGCRIPSPFISTFGNRRHAEKWARKWSKNNGNEPCDIAVIRIKKKHGVMVFYAPDLIRGLRIDTEYDTRSEYLCFHHIPSEAIKWAEV
jgi:hypothetical protein